MITGTKRPHICFSEQHIYKIHKRGGPHTRGARLVHHSSPGPPHLQHAQLGAVGQRSLSVTAHVDGRLFSLELPGGDSYTRPLVGQREQILAGFGLGRAVICRLGQRLEQVVEETGAQRFVHPVAGEQRVVHLVHALDVAGAVPVLSLQP